MGLSSAKATGQTGTAVAGTTIDVAVALGGLTPVVGWVRMVGRTETTDATGAGNLVLSYGFFVSALSRRCIGMQSVNGVTPSATDRFGRDDCVLASLDTAGVLNGRLDVNSVGANTIQFIVDQQFATNFSFQVDVLAGTDISAATIISWSLTSGTGTMDVTGVGHTARYAEHIGGIVTTNAAAAAGLFGLGRSWAPTGANQCLVVRSDDAAATSNTMCYCNDAEAWAFLGPGPEGRFTVTAAIADGFTINRIETSGSSRQMYSLVLNGTFQCNMGSSFTEDDTPTVVTVDPAFVPVLTQLMSHCKVESTINTEQAHAEVSLGSFTGQLGAAASAVGFIDVDNVNPTVVGTAVDYNAIYLNLSTVPALEGIGVAKTPAVVPATAWTMEMEDPDTALNFFAWVSFGASAFTPAIKDMISNRFSIPYPR